MAGNPMVPQGTLNRLLASMTFTQIPSLNITPPYLGKRSIRLSPQGSVTTIIVTLTGTVPSPEPVLPYRATVELLKTQPLADAFKVQQETNSVLGDCTVRSDSATLSPWQFYNMSIMDVGELDLGGGDAGYGVTFEGYYLINSALWG